MANDRSDEIEQEKPLDYEGLIIEEDERSVELGDLPRTQTLSEAEQETEQISDIKSVLKYLHHQYRDKQLNELLQSAASSRIFPDNLLDKQYAIAAPYIESHADDPDFDVMGTISMVQDALSRGFEGRQRLEDLEIGGVIHEEEIDKLSKELGLAG